MKINNLLVLILIASGLFVGCSKKDLTPIYSLNKSEASLAHNTTVQLKVDGATAETFTYTSGNSLIAIVDNFGLITGRRIGITYIKVSGNNFTDSCKVTVIPLYNIFKEPLTTFGIGKNEVKALEARTLLNESDNQLQYKGSTYERLVVYTFTNTKLASSLVVIPSSYSNDLGNFLAERYVMLQISPWIGAQIDQKYAVGAQLQSNLEWVVLYFPYQ